MGVAYDLLQTCFCTLVYACSLVGEELVSLVGQSSELVSLVGQSSELVSLVGQELVSLVGQSRGSV